MKYPAIYKSVEGSEYLYQNKDSYYCYERQVWDSSEPHHDCHHSDTNITEEYLANTYGEVKSKEHAEFIVKLATKHDIKVWNCWNKGKYFNFHTDQNGGLNLEFSNEEYAKRNGEKQITIPLPLECEVVDEWPKAGSSVEWGHTGKGEVKSLSDGFAWIKLDNKDYTTVYVSSLRKPKTPEQELRDEISDLAFNQFNDDSYDLTHNSYYLAEQLMSKYNITKKGEGDEF